MDMELRIRSGFQGERFIEIPEQTLARSRETLPQHQLYVTQLGYFPKARYHFRDRSEGCADNILFYCLSGKGYYMVADRRYEMVANTWTIIPTTRESVAYWADRDDPWTIYWIHFTGEEIDVLNACCGIAAGEAVVIRYNGEGLTAWERIYETLSRDQGAGGMLLSSLYLSHLIATFVFNGRYSAGESSTGKWQPGAAIEFMRINIGGTLTVAQMAAHSGFSASHFSKLFRLATGMPPVDYFIHLKMRRACQLLSEPHVKIKDIAAALGYEDSYYFSRLFRKSTSLSPDAYRRSLAGIFSQK